MTRWSAESDYDYYAEVRHEVRRTADVHCRRCERPMGVEADDPGPYLCHDCEERQVREAERRQRGAA